MDIIIAIGIIITGAAIWLLDRDRWGKRINFLSRELEFVKRERDDARHNHGLAKRDAERARQALNYRRKFEATHAVVKTEAAHAKQARAADRME